MTSVIVGMLAALVIAGVVVALVAIPARRAGRELLSTEGEQLVQAARERTFEVVGSAREKVGDLRLPTQGRQAPGGPEGAGPHPVPAPASHLEGERSPHQRT
jgi:hypothetical protein